MVANGLNQNFSYVRSDLSTAYNRAGDQTDTPNRKLTIRTRPGYFAAGSRTQN